MANTVLTIEEDVTNVTVQKITNAIDLTIQEDITNVTISAALPTSTFNAGYVAFDAYGGVTSTYVQGEMEEIIDKYKLGIELSKKCQKALEEAEQKIKQVTDNQSKTKE